MCDFISWIEIKQQVVFLTTDDIFHTKTGRELQKYCGCPEDLIGHGAIREYYQFTGGIERECTDFSSPDNFPPEIVKALLLGKFRKLGVPIECLIKSAQIEYKREIQYYYDKYIQAFIHSTYVPIEVENNLKKAKDVLFWKMFFNPKNRIPAWQNERIGRRLKCKQQKPLNTMVSVCCGS